MLTFYKIDAKHAHHRSPPQYINTSQYIQQRPNTIYRIGCQLLRIANTNIYRDTSVLIPSLKSGAQKKHVKRPPGRRWGHGGSKRGEVKQREEGEPSAWQLRQDGGEGANESARRISGRQPQRVMMMMRMNLLSMSTLRK